MSIISINRHEFGTTPRCSDHLTASIGVNLNIKNFKTNRNVFEHHPVSGLNLGFFSRYDFVAHLHSFRREMGILSLLAPVAIVSISLYRVLPGLETPLALLALCLAHGNDADAVAIELDDRLGQRFGGRPEIGVAFIVNRDIGFVEPVDGATETYDIVGPVCESADFLGKDRTLPTPEEGTGLVVYDTGAYGYTMSSNYNARMRPPEYLVDGDRLRQVRRAESFDDYMRLFEEGG